MRGTVGIIDNDEHLRRPLPVSLGASCFRRVVAFQYTAQKFIVIISLSSTDRHLGRLFICDHGQPC